MKKLIFFAIFAMSALGLVAQNADDIVYKSRNRVTMKSISTQSRMVVVNKDKSTKELILNQYSQDDAKGNNRTLVEFVRPAADKGTRFLTLENKGGPENRWIYLPSLNKLRRIDAASGGGTFMGTDFSYDDVSSQTRDASLDTHRVLREETLDGRICYVIESVPKDKSYQYSKMVSWIGKDNSVLYKVELYDKRSTLVKLLEMSNFEDVQGRLTQRQTKMSTLSTGTSTTIYMDKIKYDDRIPEGVFTPNYLETGKY